MNKPKGESRVSILIELRDEPASLEAALHVFSRFGVNLTHIESRPIHGKRFDFYVDCEGARGDDAIESVIRDLDEIADKLLILDDKLVPWFPRHITDLEKIAGHTLDGSTLDGGTLNGGATLQADHPGFQDETYLRRRADIDRMAREYRFGDEIPVVHYTDEENATWSLITGELSALHQQFACREYLAAFAALVRFCSYDGIPLGRDVSTFLAQRTGFRLWPVAGLLSSRDFLNGLAFRVFFSTQYIRHHLVPRYTPEPDVCHELIGHVPMFADAAFADLSQEIGLASLGASDTEIEHLARCYWHSVEFGLVREGASRKAYGAGLLSSFGELKNACQPDVVNPSEYRSWQPEEAAMQEFPITDYQDVYFVAESLQQAKETMRDYARNLPRPFYARYNATTERIWVDRAVRRDHTAS